MNSKEYQYYHSQYDRISSICRVPLKEDVIRQVNNFMSFKDESSFVLSFGFTHVHPKDNFCYKTGRDISKNKMKDFYCIISQVNFINLDMYHIELKGTDGENNVAIYLEVKKQRKSIYFVGCFIYEKF